MILTTIMKRVYYNIDTIPIAPVDAFDGSLIVYVPFAGTWWELSVVESDEDNNDDT